MEKVSIIIPVYNGERFIAASINSAFAQTYENVEVIVIDDGSSDGTLDIIKTFAQKTENLKYLHTENKGVCYARNRGIELATGEYITFLDADDQLHQNALQEMYTLLESNGADIAAVTLKTFSEGDTVDGRSTCDKAIFIWTQEEAMQKMLDDHHSMHGAVAKLYKKELLQGVRFTEGRKIHEDNFFLFECLTKINRFVFQDNKVYFRFLISGSASRSAFNEKFFDILYFADRKCKIVESMFPKFRDKLLVVQARAHKSLLVTLCKTYNKKYRKQEKECIRFLRKNMHLISPVSPFEKRFCLAIRFRIFWLYKLYLYIRMSKNFDRGKKVQK